MKNSEIAGGHFSDVVDAMDRDDKQRLVESLFMLGYHLDSLDRSDIDVDMDNVDAFPKVTWLGYELLPSTEAYNLAIDIDTTRRHP